MAVSDIILKNSLKNTHSGLPAATTAGKTQTLMLFNQDGTPANKIPLSTDAVIDLKTGQKLSDIIEYNKPYVDSDLFVDMGLPSGVLWAKANINITTDSGFTEVNGEVSPFAYDGSFCSWGNTDMHNPTSASSFAPYTWGGVNETDPPYDGQVYGSTPGAALTASFGPSYDAARANLGAPWRMPTSAEFKELFDNCEYVDADGNIVTAETSVAKTAADKRVTVNGIVGLRLRSKINGNILFFPASGYGNGASRYYRGARGDYWSSSFGSARNARFLSFSSGGVSPQHTSSRCSGFAVLPVQ